MPKELINPPDLPPPRGYNHAILVEGGRLLFLAGQDATDVDGRIIGPGDLVRQFEQALRKLERVMEHAGGTLHDVVKLNVFVRDRNDYVAKLKPLGQVFRSLFGGHYPAMALFEVSGFFNAGALVEVEGIAVLGDRSTG